MELEHMTMTDGYVGSLGKRWETPTPGTLEEAIQGAMEIEGKTREEIVTILESGQAVKWCYSANYIIGIGGQLAYDNSYGIIGRKRSAPPVEMATCDCGHTVPARQRMSASLGTSCPDCYDRMSN